MGKSQQVGCEPTRSKRILIVEDDPLLGDLLLEALQEEEAYQACHVLSGEMALNTLQTDVPALVLLDYHLPGMNGLELADWLRNREEYDHIPILLMSADAPPEVSGKKHFRTLQKPFELETLLQWVAEALVNEPFAAQKGPFPVQAPPSADKIRCGVLRWYRRLMARFGTNCLLAL